MKFIANLSLFVCNIGNSFDLDSQKSGGLFGYPFRFLFKIFPLLPAVLIGGPCPNFGTLSFENELFVALPPQDACQKTPSSSNDCSIAFYIISNSSSFNIDLHRDSLTFISITIVLLFASAILRYLFIFIIPSNKHRWSCSLS